MRHFLVAERPSVERAGGFKPDETYRIMPLIGATYTEKTLRQWIARVWGDQGVGVQTVGLTEKSPLPDLVRAVAQGGWIVLEVLQ